MAVWFDNIGRLYKSLFYPVHFNQKKTLVTLLTTSLLLASSAQAERMDGLHSYVSSASSVEQPFTLTSARNIQLVVLSPGMEGYAYDSVWHRMKQGFAMPELADALVAQHAQAYAGNAEYMHKLSERAGKYLYFILQELERRNMPAELALLPMVESGYKPDAYSRSSASGIWQFIPSTGKKFGMRQNWWYDGRRDIVDATHGALNYLQRLHVMFGDWRLALAAYNWGEGAVRRAQQKNRSRGLPTDYLSLKLPHETRNYVPKLMALRSIIEHPERYRVRLAKVADRPYFAQVKITHHMDLKLAARLAQVTLEEFNALNPGYDRPVILRDVNERILLPADKVAIFQQNLRNYDHSLLSWQPFRVDRSQSLRTLAKNLEVSPYALKRANGLSVNDKLRKGELLLVPGRGEVQQFAAFNMHLPLDSNRTAAQKRGQRIVKHTVQKGNTLSGLARQYRVTVRQIRQWNQGSLRILRPGQVLIVAKYDR